MADVTVRGDFDELDELVASFERLASSRPRERLVRELGEEALDLVDRGFESGRDPSGRRWAPPRYRSGPPLQRTGRLRGSFVLVVGPNGFEIVSRLPYAFPLQAGIRGRRGVVVRRMLPDPGEITRRWETAMRRHAHDWMREALR